MKLSWLMRWLQADAGTTAELVVTSYRPWSKGDNVTFGSIRPSILSNEPLFMPIFAHFRQLRSFRQLHPFRQLRHFRPLRHFDEMGVICKMGVIGESGVMGESGVIGEIGKIWRK